MYDGSVTDMFFHPPWSPKNEDDGWGSRERWTNDPRLKRVMRTFHQADAEEPRTPDKTTDDMLEDMENAGVEKAVFQASMYYPGTEDQLVARHVELAELTEKYPDLFLACATLLPPEQGPGTTWDFMQNVRLLEEAHKKHGFVGVHLLPSPWGTPPNHKWYYPIYARCVELGLVVVTYVGMPGPLWPTYPNHPLHLDEVALAFPDLKIVAHHIGDPWVQMMTHLAAKHANLYICTSAWSPKRYPKELLEFMAGSWHGTKGADKVVFGTDYPLLNLEKAVADARSLDLPKDVLGRFMHENAQSLFW